MRPNILIIDDTPANLDVLNGLLSQYQRRVATSGEVGLRLATSVTPPDLILLDIMMPGMDGFEVCRRLRADPRTCEVPVIFITALGEFENETRGFEVGGTDYITKPFNPAVVLARVRTQLELKGARDALKRQNALLEIRVEERSADLHFTLVRLQRSSLDTIQRLGLAAEYRDDETGRHVLRMARYAVAVARQLGWSHDEQQRLLHAAPMHDIGKIGIPDRILSKPGKLDPREWTVMKQHAAIGGRILSGSESDVIRLAQLVALTHHEKWDGTGYPRGLAGEEIPQAGRIVAIADVFDALTTRRPYKEPCALATAYTILSEGRGTHFDPAVIDAFFCIEDEILQTMHEYAGKDAESDPAAGLPIAAERSVSRS